MKKQSIYSILILCAISISQVAVFSQTQTKFAYKAELIEKKGTNVERQEVLILQDEGRLKISGVKNREMLKTFPFEKIITADYSYSEKPQIKEAIISSVLADNLFFGLAFIFTKTKKHWLVLSTESETVLLELERDTYRRLLLEMNSNGIKVEDLGDRDGKQEPMPRPKAAFDFVEEESCFDSL